MWFEAILGLNMLARKFPHRPDGSRSCPELRQVPLEAYPSGAQRLASPLLPAQCRLDYTGLSDNRCPSCAKPIHRRISKSLYLGFDPVVADVWEKDVCEFQAKSGRSGSCHLLLHFLWKITVQEMPGKTPRGPRHPSSRHPWTSDLKRLDHVIAIAE